MYLYKRTFSRYGFAIATEAQAETSELREIQQFRSRLQALDARMQTRFTQAEPTLSHEIQCESKLIKQLVSKPVRPLPMNVADGAAVNEQVVQSIYETINACAGEKVISYSSVRQLVEKHGQHTVTRVLRQMHCMHAKGRITNLAGFMVTACRVTTRA